MKSPVYVPQSTIDSQIPKAARKGVTTTPRKAPITPVTTPKPTQFDAMHDRTKQPSAPAGSAYVWIPTDAPSGGIWSLHQNSSNGAGNGDNSGNGNGNGNGSNNGNGIPTRKVVGTQMVNRGGDQVMITTYDDGTTSEQNYGVDPAVTAQKQNWRAVGQSLLDKYGIGSLGSQYFNFLDKGYDSNTALLALQSTPEWEQRFSANTARLKQGLPVLDPATYLATEEQYKAVMINAGVDKSVYNDPMTLGKIMAKDTSPFETKQRLDAAQFELNNKDPFVIEQLKQRFGMTEGDIVLHMLDPDIAAPIIAQKVQSAKIGAEAARQGLNATTVQADALAAQGITQSQAAQGFGNIGQMQEFGQNLPGDISGSLTQQQLINAQFGSNAPDQLALKNLQARRLSDHNLEIFKSCAKLPPAPKIHDP